MRLFPARFHTLAVLSMVAAAACAQQNDTWFLGHHVRLEFGGGTVVAGNGPLETLEGTACVSNASGEVLFFTNGATIWDSAYNVMPNGIGLGGGESSTQAALIVPKPGTCGIYYVFTTEDHFGDGDLRYSVVDMCLNGGYGDVVAGQKNILINAGCGEKLSAVPHDNGTDQWIISHQLGGGGFLAYRLTPTGLITTPVTSIVGANHGSTCMIGPLKASHDGHRLVCQSTFCNICELFDFDPQTGVVSNAVDLVDEYDLPGGFYGIEFSPSDELLYVSTTWITCRLYQIDLLAGTHVMLESIPGNYSMGALQLGPDGRIYVARKDEAFLDVIMYPDLPGASCGYVEQGLMLAPGTTSDVGMPNMIPATVMGYAPQPPSVDLGGDTSLCGATPFLLGVGPGCNVDYLWQDGSTADEMLVDAPGTYWVQMTTACGSAIDSLIVTAGTSASMAPVEGCAWSPLTITAQVMGTPANWNWDFGDGTTSTTSGTQVHVYYDQGTFPITLIVGDPGDLCTDTVSTWAVIGPPETAGGDTSLVLCTTDPVLELVNLLDQQADMNGTWYDSDWSTIPSSFDPATSGSTVLAYVITGVHCGADTAFAIIDVEVCQGIDDVGTISGFVRPVPADDKLMFDGAMGPAPMAFTIVDPSGRVIMSQRATVPATFDVSVLCDGHYFLVCHGTDGTRSYHRFIVAHR